MTRVLVLCGDRPHPPAIARSGLAALGTDEGKSEWQFEWIEDGREWSATVSHDSGPHGRNHGHTEPEKVGEKGMGQFPLVVLAKTNHASHSEHSPWITPEVEEAFVAYVRAGGGLLALHSGTSVRDTPALRKLLGGTFTHHPPQCEMTITPQGEHPIVLKLEPFSIFDEHYQMEIDDLEAMHFLTTSSVHGAQSGGWLRTEGAGRVCVLSPAHTVENWLHPEFQTLLRNALRWCAGELA